LNDGFKAPILPYQKKSCFMEKKRTMLVTLAALSVVFYAAQCNYASGPTGPAANNPALMAKWNVSSVQQTYGTTTDTVWPLTQAVLQGSLFSGSCALTFTQDLHYQMTIAGTISFGGVSQPIADTSFSGSWTSSGNTLSMKKTDDPTANVATYSISGTTLTIKETDKGSNGQPDTLTTIVATN
jgi:hypothetical protein